MNELTEKQRYWQTHLETAANIEGLPNDYAKLHDINAKKLYVFKGVLQKRQGLIWPSLRPLALFGSKQRRRRFQIRRR